MSRNRKLREFPSGGFCVLCELGCEADCLFALSLFIYFERAKERERERTSVGEGQREREGKRNPKQASYCQRGA